MVDTGVTEARNWDFFLQSHHALQGTARPAHYFVLLNEIFTQEFIGRHANISDYLQKLTYDMCYLFGRSTGPVSIPPPVYYADLACERSRCYGDFDDDISDTSSIVADDKGKPQGSLGEAQSAQKGYGMGSQAPNRPGPSTQGPSTQGKQKPSKPITNRQGPGYTAPVQKEVVPKKQVRPTETRLPDLMTGLTKKERARVFEERAAAGQKAQGESSKADGKKPEAKPSATPEAKPDYKAEAKSEAKAKGKQPGSQAEGTKREEKLERPKAEEKKPETRAQVQKAEEQEEEVKPKEKAKIEIHSKVSKMFYI